MLVWLNRPVIDGLFQKKPKQGEGYGISRGTEEITIRISRG